ncbi:hypothetical protein AB0M48_38960 [Lentzea sp. NPDC051208]|uniref:hypothetical protein n=1 Tax=Lentzea sp. NPDC051208 TaxID=3154642 RepID=UPI0034202880
MPEGQVDERWIEVAPNLAAGEIRADEFHKLADRIKTFRSGAHEAAATVDDHEHSGDQ